MHNLASPELIILIFLSGLGQHCAEWSSRVPNCSSVLFLKLLFSPKRKSIERQMYCIFEIIFKATVAAVSTMLKDRVC